QDPGLPFASVQNNPAALLSYITERDAAIRAEIDTLDSKTGAVTGRQGLLLVRDGPTWSKYGKSSAYPHGLVRQVPLDFQPSPQQFTVNYDTGLVTSGRPLQAGERLVLSGFQFLPGTRKVKTLDASTPCGGQTLPLGLQVGTKD